MDRYLNELCCAFGPTGCEGPVAEIIRKKGEAPGAACRTDRSGNVIFTYEPKELSQATKTVMVTAHMDEVGFMINEIDDEGYLRFAVLGDVDPRVLCGRNVWVGDETRRVMGVIASKAIHHQSAEERAKITEIDDMYIDIGADSRKSAEEQVSLGDFGTFCCHLAQPFGEEKKYIRAKALDNRAACAVMLDVMARLADGSLVSPHRLHFCFAVRGEAGPSGASLVAESIQPQVAIVLDAAVAADLPGVTAALRMAELSRGAVIPFADDKTIYCGALAAYTEALAAERGIAAQIKGKIPGGREAAEIQKRGMGAELLALSIPVRYAHTASSVAHRDDIRAVTELLAALLGSPLSSKRGNDGGRYV